MKIRWVFSLTALLTVVPLAGAMLTWCGDASRPSGDTHMPVDTPAGDDGSPALDTSRRIDVGGPTDCGALELGLARVVWSVRQESKTCEAASDCELVIPSLTCPGGALVESCEVAISVGEAPTVQAAIDEATPGLCQHMTTPCVSLPGCQPVVAGCVAGLCEVVPVAP